MPPPTPLVATVPAIYRYTLLRDIAPDSCYLLNTVGKSLIVGCFTTRVESVQAWRGLMELKLTSRVEIPKQTLGMFGMKMT